MARTRVNSNNAVDPAVPTTPGASSPLPRSTNLGSMQKVFILPRRATPEARIVLLPNSIHGRPARYLMCPETGLCSTTTAEARIVVDSNIYMATPLDPVFLVLPALEGRQAFSKEAHGKRSLFRSSDDYLDELSGDLPHLCEILSWPGTKALFRDRMAAVCDSVEADDEIMFRLNEDKLAKVILSKAMMLSDGGLPSTMEQRFVIRVLEAPPPLSKQETDHQGLPLQSDSTDSSAVTSDTATAPPSRPAATNISRADQNGASETVTNASEPPLHIIHLQRLRVALDFICSNYISPSLTQRLFIILIDSGLADFSPLDDYLASVIKRRAAAVHLSSLSNLSRKRSDEDDEARVAKKRKLEDEKRQTATESRGVRQLKKADTSGMKKLSAFFRKF